MDGGGTLHMDMGHGRHGGTDTRTTIMCSSKALSRIIGMDGSTFSTFRVGQNSEEHQEPAAQGL